MPAIVAEFTVAKGKTSRASKETSSLFSSQVQSKLYVFEHLNRWPRLHAFRSRTYSTSWCVGWPDRWRTIWWRIRGKRMWPCTSWSEFMESKRIGSCVCTKHDFIFLMLEEYNPYEENQIIFFASKLSVLPSDVPGLCSIWLLISATRMEASKDLLAATHGFNSDRGANMGIRKKWR